MGISIINETVIKIGGIAFLLWFATFIMIVLAIFWKQKKRNIQLGKEDRSSHHTFSHCFSIIDHISRLYFVDFLSCICLSILV